MDAKKLRDLSDSLHAKKSPLNSLWQEVGDNFYPERADFTLQRALGTDFAANLMSSYPVLCRRDLGNLLGTMLRRKEAPWFHLGIKYEDRDQDKTEDKQWLQYFEETMRRAMYDRPAQFARATKEGDHDFAAFGQCALSVQINKMGNGMLYQCWHLRDMAWQTDGDGEVSFVTRRWKPTAQQLVDWFGDKAGEKVTEIAGKTPFEEIECIHMVCKAEMYDDSANGRPRWSIYYDTQHNRLIEATPIWGRFYIIPRWQTVSSAVWGSQYAYSPAVIAALPDARLIQAMTFTLLEAGEKATSPPIIATKDAVRSDVALYAGGITWVDQEYDERLGEALRPLTQDFRGFNYGLEMNQDTRTMIHKAFFLDTLTMPQNGPEMTAYEVGQRIQEYIRNALPIFEPIESEYNAPLCEETFELMRRAGAFGSPLDWPKTLRDQQFSFHFESPLHDTIDQAKGQKFVQAQPLVSAAAAIDPSAVYVIDVKEALRDALSGTIPAAWMRTKIDVDQMAKARQQQEAQQNMLASMEQGSNIAKNLGVTVPDQVAV